MISNTACRGMRPNRKVVKSDQVSGKHKGGPRDSRKKPQRSDRSES